MAEGKLKEGEAKMVAAAWYTRSRDAGNILDSKARTRDDP